MKSDKQIETEEDLHLIKSTFEKNQTLSHKLFKHMPIGICITNSQGYFTDVNNEYCKIYGYTKDELVGSSFTRVVPDNDKHKLKELHDEFLDKKFELRGKWTVQDKQGKLFDIVTNAAYLYNEVDQEPRKMTLVVKAAQIESTLRKLKSTIEILENKLEAQDVAFDLAEHDMHNNIGSIVSIADVLRHTNLDEQQLKWVNMIKNIGKDTLKLLESSKDYSKMERGIYEPDITKFDLLFLLTQEINEFDDLLAFKEATLKIYLNDTPIKDDSSILIEGDKFYLKHLFINIITNALEASPQKAVVEVYLYTQEQLTVKIKNEGMVPEDIQPHFFEKYATSGKEKGTGLGTYISKMIAEFHGGSISFVSTKDEGTTVHITFPQKMLL